MRDGFAGVSIVGYVPDDRSTYGHGAMVEEPVYGDVTGDGIDDAIVHVYCYHVPGEYYVPDDGTTGTSPSCRTRRPVRPWSPPSTTPG